MSEILKFEIFFLKFLRRFSSSHVAISLWEIRFNADAAIASLLVKFDLTRNPLSGSGN